MRLTVLASGSKGNSLVVQGGSTTLMVDLGLSWRQLSTRMRACGLDPERIDGVLFTHDHSDHCGALEVFHRHHPTVPLFANDGTADTIGQHQKDVSDGWTCFETNVPFQVGDIAVENFSVPHDATDPVGYLFTCGEDTLFVGTDFGTVTMPVRQAFARAQCAVLESNHDAGLLETSDRPFSLKQRIHGRSGHLSNDDAADLLRTVRPPRLEALFLAHLSEDCNAPHLAIEAVREAAVAIGRSELSITALSQNEPMPTFSFGADAKK